MAPNAVNQRRTTHSRPSTALGAVLRPPSSILAALSLALPLLAGCNIRAIVGLDMYNQGKVKTYRQSDFFEDRLSARPLVAGTVARKEQYPDRTSTGIDYEKVQYAGDAYPPGFLGEGDTFDDATFKAKAKRGETVYNAYCAVCHGQTGKGDGMIVQRGFHKPPSFVVPTNPDELKALQQGDPYRWQRTEYLQTSPPRHVYTAISHGWGGMYSYGERVKPDDRWAVAAYIKTLQANPTPPDFKPEMPTPAAPASGLTGQTGTGQPAAK